ncbi:hypothetical protein AMAG_08087 [Allomyces macrogynus ATCC 38327]|uniref:AN1-type domain-containing protein n=1 Tax=Allomyces macrogynus (strain ATCC 38327) TaxID=578462 RepID=A0A0L0SKG6_ALLM3|nr:hypothetical protein AMAG_08087 [Allomyces macrogynus ATCC 38327]|eukprot:KNE62909.1 hypothetical protein AMAG_08087 [Allomyces macrogynus ATCC 38327]
MELPDVGKNCGLKECKQLDFLPYTCHRCQGVFCHEHWKPADHNCPRLHDPAYDRVVPQCPLCGVAVPVARNEDPNARMDAHISSGCRPPPSSGASPNKAVYAHKCHVRGCTNKSAVAITCKACGHQYCLKHRNERDHACAPPPPPPTSSASSAMAAVTSRLANLPANLTDRKGAGRRGSNKGSGGRKNGKGGKDDCVIC